MYSRNGVCNICYECGCLFVFVCVCVRACVRACVRVCVCASDLHMCMRRARVCKGACKRSFVSCYNNNFIIFDEDKRYYTTQL